jgi:tRNA(Ile)-lysidine synthase
MNPRNLAVTADCLTGLLPSDISSLAVAVSGGADSFALTFLAKDWCTARGVTLYALTVDHGLRAESAAEAKRVQALLTAQGITHHILTWEHEETPASNIHHEAREARYHLMSRWCEAHQVAHLLLGHHYDDQAENVLIRLLRGSGVDGLAAMESVKQRGAITVVRPLLPFRKKALEEYLTARGMGWGQDPSNDNPRYTRVQVRNFLRDPAPLTDDGELLTKRLHDMAEHMARTRDYLEGQVGIAWDNVVTPDPLGHVTLDYEAFAALHPELGLRVLAKLLGRIGGNTYRPRFEKLERLYSRLCEDKNFPGATLEGVELLPSHRGKVMVVREYADIPPPVLLEAGKHCWDGRFTLTLPRPLQVGALGKEGVALLEKKRLTLPKKCYYGLPGFWEGEKLVAVPQLGVGEKHIGSHSVA